MRRILLALLFVIGALARCASPSGPPDHATPTTTTTTTTTTLDSGVR